MKRAMGALAWLLLLLMPDLVLAQGKQILSDGFERFSTSDNLWDGVDSDGYIAGERFSVPALLETGSVGNVSMPISVAVADLNADGLTDVLTADPVGYFRLYLNSGSPAEPKFTTGELIPLFFAFPERLIDPDTNRDNLDDRVFMRRVPKIGLTAANVRGSRDLLIGFYGGEVAFIPNTGGPSSPVFAQPSNLAAAMIPTAEGGRLWGNLFAPAAVDWDEDGRMDLLLGEGSYSANAVHLLLNKSTGSTPAFGEGSRQYLAYGDGKEQLHPAVVDYNGDGRLDLLMSDRKGTISAFLTPAGWKRGDELKLSFMVSPGSQSAMGGPVSLAVGDLNGDGLFDLVMGKANGRVALSFNAGSATQPNFGAAVEIKGTDVYPRTLRLPAGWDCNGGLEKGNQGITLSVVDAKEDPLAQPPQGTHVFKAYYSPPLNKVIRPGLPEAAGVFDLRKMTNWDSRHTAFYYSYYSTTRAVVMTRRLARFEVGKTYQLSFQAKGSGVRNAKYVVCYRGSKQTAPPRVERGERGSATVTRFENRESNAEDGIFDPASAWRTVSRTFTIQFENAVLKKEKTVSEAMLLIMFELSSPDAVLYLDDFRIVQKS